MASSASHEQAIATVLSQIALSFDGAFLGVTLAFVAVRSLTNYTARSKALRKIRNAPTVKVSDLRSLLELPPPPQPSDENNSNNLVKGQTLVILRGQVEAKSSVDGNWKSFRPNGVLVAHESGDKAVIVQRVQTCIYNEWKGLFGWNADFRAILTRSRRERESTVSRMVPFVLVEDARWPQSEYVFVNMDGSTHPLPLTTVYHQLKPVDPSPYTFLQALFGHEYPVGLLDEEKILPLGKEINAVGVCSSNNGSLEIKSCKDLHFFLSNMTKEQMIDHLALRAKVLLWSGIILGSAAICILGYAAVRNWNRFKAWRQERQVRREQQNRSLTDTDDPQIDAEDETDNVPDGQLCVICLMRRKRSAFIPCGHLVCCQLCAIAVEREVSPKCPLCRQAVRNSMRIFDC
ncbi:E3 ubiquitin-protein ligase SPL2 [Mercurialis annua]|uniref:E3 ubiquitin-protein ligase SPL2 n=1 Tax=Mercurialis annua TaxID=3986 RepID=UPI00216066D7|nr:E3 ubiquitin-protein ligase SPL2 [Mercurialis annua]